jgi:hypothetical protein
MAHVTVDGRDYELTNLSEAARQQITNLNAVDEELRQLQVRVAICQTARNAYATALKSELPKDT